MKISERWLREWINPQETVEALCARLTGAGLEVGLIETIQGSQGLADTVFEIELTPNRGDCSSILGVARELAALYQLPLTQPSLKIYPKTNPHQQSVSVLAEEACPYYLGQVITDFNTEALTPSWMKERLAASGIACIHLAVDILNYVMLEYGQPLHAFDLAKLSGNLSVRWAQPTELITLLDGRQVSLETNTLVIADEAQCLAIAGIMGGLAALVTRKTTSLLIESAWFRAASMAGKARQYGLQTQASYRFERGIDPNAVKLALDRACQLLVELAGCSLGQRTEVGAACSAYPSTVHFDPKLVHQILGTQDPALEIAQALDRLGFRGAGVGETWAVQVPSYRQDIHIPVDLVGELARLRGLDRIPLRLFRAPLRAVLDCDLKRRRQLKRVFLAQGLQEAITYSFVCPKRQALISSIPGLELQNPIADHRSVMRTTLWTGLLEVLSYHQARQQERVRLFEVGTCFYPDHKGVQEEVRVAGVLAGTHLPKSWRHAKKALDFFDLKELLETVIRNMGHRALIQYTPVQHKALHPGLSAQIHLNDHLLGLGGAVHPSILKSLELTGPIWLFDLNVAPLIKTVEPHLEAIAKFPSVGRDLALLVPEERAVGEVLATIESFLGQQLQTLELFDIYQGPGLPLGHRSVAIGLILQDLTRTLVDTEVEQLLSSLVGELKETLGVTLRVK